MTKDRGHGNMATTPGVSEVVVKNIVLDVLFGRVVLDMC